MGFRTLEQARATQTGKPASKAVLMALAWHACDDCGCAWPGHGALSDWTELGRSTIATALAALVKDGLLVIGRFSSGGRGLSTEYVVLPQRTELSPAPCGECRKRMKNPPAIGWFSRPARGNRPESGPFTPETVQSGAENPPAFGHQQSVTTQQSGEAAPRSVEPAPPGGQAFDHPSDDPAGRLAAQEALRAVAAMVRGSEPPNDPERGKAQG